MNSNKLRRSVAFLLALVLMIGLLPAEALATDSIGVTVSLQQEGYLLPRTELEITPGLAEEYGYQNANSVQANQATMLDALVALHIHLLSTELFSPQTATEYLAVTENGTITKILAEDTNAFGFMQNGAQPLSDVWNPPSGGWAGYYTGYLINEAVIHEGDVLEFFFYQDTYWSDYCSWFESNGVKTEKLSAAVGEEIDLSLLGYMLMFYGASDSDTIKANTVPLCDAQLALIDSQTGNATDINNTLTDSTDGTFTVKFVQEGTYILSAYVTQEDITENYATPIIMPWCEITVGATSPTPPETGGEGSEDEENPSTPPDDGNATFSAEDMPTSVDGYLPAPGQFVNIDLYADPNKTLDPSTGDIITLGSFGGSITYYFEDAIKNDSKNPYGVDFIVYGNPFRNSDGSSSSSAAEPGAVMVSDDGDTWYELAGSIYWDAAVKYNTTITYANPDTSFEACAEVSWHTSDGSQGKVSKSDYYTQPYYPNPQRYNSFNTGKSANNTYTGESVSFTGTRFNEKCSPAYGYADSHALTSPLSNTAVNPYAENHYANTNGDGMDISWAVNQNGEQVELSQVHYIKIYNPTLYDSGSIGEISPEIAGILRAKPGASDVGKSSELTALSVNGKEIALTQGKFDYSFDLEGAQTLSVTPTAGADANIYVNNIYVKSGETAQTILPGNKLCIIVQSGEKAPVRYIIALENSVELEKNTALKSVTVIPGDLPATAEDNNVYSLTVGAATSSVRVQAIPMAAAATVTVDDVAATQGENWVADKIISLTPGETTDIPIVVTSADKSTTAEYTLKVTRREEASSGSSTPSNNITVYFTLKGDSVHGTPEAHRSYETWIRKKSYSVPVGSTVKYLTDKVLIENGISFTVSADGTYITSIKGLGETSNGPNSGWMYKLNGTHDGADGYAVQTLNGGDSVEWHYTDDYTKEDDMEEWSGGSYGGSSSDSSNTQDEEDVNDETENTQSGYADIKGHWAEKSIEFVSEKGILMGTGTTVFTPNGNVTRAMLAVILHRLENTPDAKASAFTDIPASTWYTSAVAWAAEQKIVNGVGKNAFAPDTPITREAFAVMLYRYANTLDMDTSSGEVLSKFSDASKISDWARDAISWAVQNNLLGGKSGGVFDPAGYLTRAEAAAVLERWINR